MEEKRQTAPQDRSPEGAVQNFFIVLPNASLGREAVGNVQAENILHAVRTALSGAAAKPAAAAKSATFEEVGREWFRHNVGSWATSYKGRLKIRLETYLRSA